MSLSAILFIITVYGMVLGAIALAAGALFGRAWIMFAGGVLIVIGFMATLTEYIMQNLPA